MPCPSLPPAGPGVACYAAQKLIRKHLFPRKENGAFQPAGEEWEERTESVGDLGQGSAWVDQCIHTLIIRLMCPKAKYNFCFQLLHMFQYCVSK